MKGSGIIGANHTRIVAPLMSRALPLYLMVPGVSLDGTTLVDEALPPPKWRSVSRRRWSLQRMMSVLPLISYIWCWGTPQCGRNRGSLTS